MILVNKIENQIKDKHKWDLRLIYTTKKVEAQE